MACTCACPPGYSVMPDPAVACAGTTLTPGWCATGCVAINGTTACAQCSPPTNILPWVLFSAGATLGLWALAVHQRPEPRRRRAHDRRLSHIGELEREAGVGPPERAAWDRAASEGYTDARGGEEYRRWLVERAEGSRESPAAFGREAARLPR